MPSTVLEAGMATAIGSLPHRDAAVASTLVLRCLPELPAVPQLPNRTVYESVLAEWLGGVDGIRVADDGMIALDHALDLSVGICTELSAERHGGLLAFVDATSALPCSPKRVKAQVTGPLTLGVALARRGAGGRSVCIRRRGLAELGGFGPAALRERLPEAALVLFFDEPALVLWNADDPPLERELATDILSGTLASSSCVTGVHVCGRGDLRLALDAGPDIVHVDVDAVAPEDALALSRFLDGEGWIAWGAVPTHGPIGEHPTPLWKAMLELWCELTRRGCDPVQLRTHALVTPACGLAGHGPSQAERAMLLARELGNRVHDQAAATKLSIGA